MITDSNKPLRVAVIGAGVRGTSLARQLSSLELNVAISAVAEPDAEKRTSFAEEFSLPSETTFAGWEELTDKLSDCDAAVIATLDNQHTGPAIACLERDWHILMEKPLADNFDDCLNIVRKQEEKERVVAVCHTLRFMDGFRRVKEIVDAGTIGMLINVEHMEGIGHFRFAHNYVRGRWSKEKNNTFLLLHKCSHDIDYISWLFREQCMRVSSFGSLNYFTPGNAPEGSAARCTGGCGIIGNCPYSSLKIYVDGPLEEWPARDICKVHTREEHMRAVETGPHGLCVWHAGNDVVAHHVVMMEFKGGATATCTLTGYSATNGRRIRLQGTLGELLFDESAGSIKVKKFACKDELIENIDNNKSYHPEDKEIVSNWISSIRYSEAVVVDAQEALRTHAVVFAAEISRKEKRTVEMSELLDKITISSL